MDCSSIGLCVHFTSSPARFPKRRMIASASPEKRTSHRCLWLDDVTSVRHQPGITSAPAISESRRPLSVNSVREPTSWRHLALHLSPPRSPVQPPVPTPCADGRASRETLVARARHLARPRDALFVGLEAGGSLMAQVTRAAPPLLRLLREWR